MCAMAEDPIVTLATYMNLAEADLARGKLQSEGIECWLADDNMVRMSWLYGNLLNGVKLQVKQEDAEHAWEVLSEPIPPELQDDQTGKIYEQPKCPKCGSLDISYENRNRWMSLAVVWATALPIPFFGTRWRCDNCGAQWVNEHEDEREEEDENPT